MPVYKLQKGFTLVELIIAMVVMAIAVTMIANSFAPRADRSAHNVVQTRAAELGLAYIEEILSKRFDEANGIGGEIRCNAPASPACSAIGPDGIETRATYDDVDDFDVIANETPVDPLGVARANYAAFDVSVDVAYADAEFGLAAGTLKRVNVTVTHISTNQSFIFSVYKGNF